MSFRASGFPEFDLGLASVLRNFSRLIIVLFVLLAIASLAFGQGDTTTQVVVSDCNAQGNCSAVTFHPAFGSAPTVYCSIRGTTLYQTGPGPSTIDAIVDQNQVSPTGFTPRVATTGSFSGAHLTCVAVGPRLLTGTAVPTYIVLTIAYAPPGTNGGHSTSSVVYKDGSSTGTTTSASQSFQSSNSVSFQGSGGFLGNGGGAGLSFQYTTSTTDSQSLDIKKTALSQITKLGPGQDGINHDEDEILLALNPTVNLALSSSSAAWIFANTQTTTYWVKVGNLNGDVPMPTPIATVLQSAGITSANYADICSRDPLATCPGATTTGLDPRRFVPLNTTFPYEPPLTATDPVTTVSVEISDRTTSTVGSMIQDTYKVGLALSASGDFLGFAKATLKDTTSWQWTNKTSQSLSTGTSQSASLTIGGPAFGYTGGTIVQAYIDTMYQTFAFAIVSLVDQEASVDGNVVTSTGTPVPQMTEVVLTENGVKHRTFTNSRGEYHFYGHITAPASVQAGGVTKTVPQSQGTTRHAAFRLP